MQARPMTELTTVMKAASTTTRPTKPVVTGPLKCWLLDEPTDDRAIATIARSELLRGQAAMLLPVLRQAAARPATHGEIMDIIGSRFVTFPQPKRSESEAAAWWADYFTALEGLTPAQVEGGMAAHIRDPKAEFLPKPGKLAELAKTAGPGRWMRAYHRARKACEATAPALAAPVAPRATPEEVREMMTDFSRRMAEKAPPPVRRPPRPAPQAVVDDRGMSAEASELLARQHGGR